MLKKIPDEIEAWDGCDPQPMKGPPEMFGVLDQMLREKVNEIIDYLNKQEKQWEDGK